MGEDNTRARHTHTHTSTPATHIRIAADEGRVTRTSWRKVSLVEVSQNDGVCEMWIVHKSSSFSSSVMCEDNGKLCVRMCVCTVEGNIMTCPFVSSRLTHAYTHTNQGESGTYAAEQNEMRVFLSCEWMDLYVNVGVDVDGRGCVRACVPPTKWRITTIFSTRTMSHGRHCDQPCIDHPPPPPLPCPLATSARPPTPHCSRYLLHRRRQPPHTYRRCMGWSG